MNMPCLILVTALSAGGAAADTTRLPVPVYNQAYQENFEPDRIADILETARNGYVLLDPFQDDPSGTTAANVAALRANGNDVGAYISIGTGEDWRDDFATLKPHLVTKGWEEWPGEYYVSDPSAEVVAVMTARIDRIADWGFTWVEFDNMDWASDDAQRKDYAIKASAADGVAYASALCDHAHSRGVKCMAKSTVEGAGDFDGVVYESYPDDQNWWDRDEALDFVAQGKLVIVNHYNEPDCAAAYRSYQAIYGPTLSFICEDAGLKRYVHFNQ